MVDRLDLGDRFAPEIAVDPVNQLGSLVLQLQARPVIGHQGQRQRAIRGGAKFLRKTMSSKPGASDLAPACNKLHLGEAALGQVTLQKQQGVLGHRLGATLADDDACGFV